MPALPVIGHLLYAGIATVLAGMRSERAIMYMSKIAGHPAFK
jgi:hypothetical protein